MVIAAIVAGGMGSRMGTNIPKQFLRLGSRRILLWSVETFLHHPQVDTVVVGVPREWLAYAGALFDEQIPGPLDERLSEKMRMDGIPKNALKPITGKELDYESLMAFSLKYADAVIQCEPGVNEKVLEAAASLPKLDFFGGEDDVNRVKDFYASL